MPRCDPAPARRAPAPRAARLPGQIPGRLRAPLRPRRRTSPHVRSAATLPRYRLLTRSPAPLLEPSRLCDPRRATSDHTPREDLRAGVLPRTAQGLGEPIRGGLDVSGTRPTNGYACRRPLPTLVRTTLRGSVGRTI